MIYNKTKISIAKGKNMTAKDFDYIIELKNKWLQMAQMVDEHKFDQKAFERLAKETAIVLQKNTTADTLPYEVVCLLLSIKDFVYTPTYDSLTYSANDVAYALCDLENEFGIYEESSNNELFVAVDLKDASFDLYLDDFDITPLVEYYDKQN